MKSQSPGRPQEVRERKIKKEKKKKAGERIRPRLWTWMYMIDVNPFSVIHNIYSIDDLGPLTFWPHFTHTHVPPNTHIMCVYTYTHTNTQCIIRIYLSCFEE